MRKIIHVTSLHILGWACIALGLLGLLLPILPGIVLIVVGIYLISLASQWLGLKIETIKVRYPRFGYHLNKLDAKVNKLIKRAY